MSTAAVAAKLVIYAYTSFTSSWGPGPTIAKKFEAHCHCQVELVNAGEGGALISRLKLEGENTEADVVVGLDGNSLEKVKTELKWKPSFIAYDHGPYAFVYNTNVVKNPPRSLDDLLDPRFKNKIALEDPRLSTTGLGFLLWVVKEKGDGVENREKKTDDAWAYLKKLRTQSPLVTPSWDLAYGLFKKNKVDLVFSYWTSPAYHIQEEKIENIKAAVFSHGHYRQTEFMFAVPPSGKDETTPKDSNEVAPQIDNVKASSKHEELKTDFINFMLSSEAQEELPRRNFMFPVNKKAALTPAFKKIGTVKTLDPVDPAALKIDLWLKKWREIFS